jgi:hypothetical protein
VKKVSRREYHVGTLATRSSFPGVLSKEWKRKWNLELGWDLTTDAAVWPSTAVPFF